MPQSPVPPEVVERMRAMFGSHTDSEIADATGFGRHTVSKYKMIWRDEQRARIASRSSYRESEVSQHNPPPEVPSGFASAEPPVCSQPCSCASPPRVQPAQIRVQSTPERVQHDAVTIPSPAPEPVEVRGGDRLRRVLMFGDAHIPYHDRTAWEVFMRAADAFRPDVLVCLGDLADVYSLSGYTADPSRPSRWEDELCAVRDELDRLDAIGADEKVFVAGNHEDRLPRYLAKRAPHLYESTSVPEQLQLEARGWRYVPHGQSAMVGKVMMTHDLDRYGIYAVRHALRDAGTNVVIGHIHRMCVWYEGSMSGNNQVAASFGWLGGTEWATYRHRVRAERDWAHGFGVGYMEPDGNMHMQAVPIINGACVVEGRVIR